MTRRALIETSGRSTGPRAQPGKLALPLYAEKCPYPSVDIDDTFTSTFARPPDLGIHRTHIDTHERRAREPSRTEGSPLRAPAGASAYPRTTLPYNTPMSM